MGGYPSPVSGAAKPACERLHAMDLDLSDRWAGRATHRELPRTSVGRECDTWSDGTSRGRRRSCELDESATAGDAWHVALKDRYDSRRTIRQSCQVCPFLLSHPIA